MRPAGCLVHVSIHAPARGATRRLLHPFWMIWSFNPRSRAGSDMLFRMMDSAYIKFQSTLPRGERRGLTSPASAADRFQSTLPRGERRPSCKVGNPWVRFQSTLPRGERHPGPGVWSLSTSRFQSTLPRGERPAISASAALVPGFQSTLPRGERLFSTLHHCISSAVSIHAPARGATLFQPSPIPLRFVSIHAPARGATPAPAEGSQAQRVSIHAPARGATRSTGGSSRRARSFNPRSRAGSDQTERER